MINAEQARKIAKQARSDERYITYVIGNIEERIQESAERGNYSTVFELDLTERGISDTQKQNILDYLSSVGFNAHCFVTTQGNSEQTMSITISWEKK